MKWRGQKRKPATAQSRARAALEDLSAATLRYFAAVSQDMTDEGRRKAAAALTDGGRVLTAVSVQGGSASVLISVIGADGETHRLHYLDQYGAGPAPVVTPDGSG